MTSQKEAPLWKTPQEIMKFHRAKRKLARRMCTPSPVQCPSTNNEESLMEFPNPPPKRWTPFLEKSNLRVEVQSEESGFETDASSHSSDNTTMVRQFPTTPTSFTNLFNRLHTAPGSNGSSPEEEYANKSRVTGIPIDWSLKNKIRFMSTRPIPWSGTMRTGEEVSALTGFVRCLSPGASRAGAPRNLDTSINAQLHQCVQFWHHPHLPWNPNFLNTYNKLSPEVVAAQQQIADTLYAEWTIAFRSLFQLVRTRQCPYFYLIGNQFNCVFRAAGIAGMVEMHAIISTTTRGFRKMLEDEDISYSMPLRQKQSLDSENSIPNNINHVEEDPDEDVEEWMDAAHMKKLSVAQKSKDRRRECRIDGFDESAVLVSGMDIQSLFNLLVNIKNPLDRVPASLISPTAFRFATLKCCTVRDSIIHVDGNRLYSIYIEGPIMPHALWDLCRLLKAEGSVFSAAIATVRQTQVFTEVTKRQTAGGVKEGASIFLKEDLSDCGLSREALSRFCDNDVSKYSLINSIEPEQLNF